MTSSGRDEPIEAIPSRRMRIPSAAEVLPHRSTLLLLATVELYEEDRLTGTGIVGRDSQLAVQEWVPSVVAVEMAAQAAAYHSSLPGWRSGVAADTKGFLVRIKQVELTRPTLNVTSAVSIEVELQGKAGGLALYSFSLSEEVGLLSEGQLSILRG